jgi:hypothetical protein
VGIFLVDGGLMIFWRIILGGQALPLFLFLSRIFFYRHLRYMDFSSFRFCWLLVIFP